MKLGKTAKMLMCQGFCMLSLCALATDYTLSSNYVSWTIFAGLQAYTEDMYRYTEGNRNISK